MVPGRGSHPLSHIQHCHPDFIFPCMSRPARCCHDPSEQEQDRPCPPDQLSSPEPFSLPPAHFQEAKNPAASRKSIL